MHQQWFHILPCMETPLWMQCQSSQHCPKWYNCHTTGSDKTLLLSSTTCTTPTCTMHAAHIYCACITGNPDETGCSCSWHVSCSEECPSTNACNIPCHTCAATEIWPYPHGTRMPDPGDLGTINPDCPQTLYHYALPHTSPVNCFVMYHNLRKGDVVWLLHLDLRTAPAVPVDDCSSISWYIYIILPTSHSTCHLVISEHGWCKYVSV